MNNDEYLFIGGIKDGQRMSVSKEHTCLRVPCDFMYASVDSKIQFQVYTKYRLCDENQKDHFVFVCRDAMGRTTVIENLLEGYRRR